MYSLQYLYVDHFSSWLKKEVKMNSFLTGLAVFGVLMLFKNTNGETNCDDDNKTIRSCDGSYKSGNYISVGLNRSCYCTVNALFTGELLVTAYKDASYQCRTEVTVSSGTITTVFNCANQSPSAIRFNVSTNKTFVSVKTNYIQTYTSGSFYFCLGINQNGGLGGIVSVTCGNSTTTTTTKSTTSTTSTAARTTTTTTTISPSKPETTTTIAATTSPSKPESTTTTTAATTTPSKPETSSSTTTYNTTIAVNSSPQKSTYPSSDNVTYIITGAAAGSLVLVVVVIALVAIVVLRKKKGRKKSEIQKTHEAPEHTNRAFEENYGLPDNPLYHSAQPIDEVGYSSVQKNQLGLPPTEATIKKNNDPNYDVPTNNKPINDSDTSPMPIYAVPNKSRASVHEDNEPQAMYAQVSKPSKITTQVPMQSTNQDGLVYLEAEKDAISVNENSPYTKNENNDSVSYAGIKRN